MPVEGEVSFEEQWKRFGGGSSATQTPAATLPGEVSFEDQWKQWSAVPGFTFDPTYDLSGPPPEPHDSDRFFAEQRALQDVSQDSGIFGRGLGEGLQSLGDTLASGKERLGQLIVRMGLVGGDEAQIAQSMENTESSVAQRKLEAESRDALNRRLNQESALPGWLADGVYDATSMVTQSVPAAAAGGLPALAAQYGFSAANDAYIESKGNAGYAAIMAGLEVGVMALGGKIAQKFGAKTFEEMLGKGPMQSLKKWLIGTGIELGEEQTALATQTLASAIADVRELPTKEQYAKQVGNTAVATLLAGGFVGTPSAVAGFVEAPTRSNARKLGLEEVLPSKRDREAVAKGAQSNTAPLGLMGMPDVTGEAANLGKSLQKGWRKWFTRGLANKETLALLDQRKGLVARRLQEAEYANRDLKKAAKKAFGRVTPEISQQLDAALKDPQLMESLPLEVVVPLQQMRDHVDFLSREVMKLPGISGSDLELTIDENLGQYVTRTYKKFDSPRWIDEALSSPQIMADFAAEVRESSPDLSDTEIRTLAERLLRKDTMQLGDTSTFSPAARQYVSVLKKRKDLPVALRRLFGENLDVFANYSTSVSKMASLVANRQFVQSVKETGLESGFLSPSSDLSNPEHTATINPQLRELAPLADVAMHPDLAEALNDIYTSKIPSKIASVVVGAMGYSKAAKTIQSWTANIRNLVGGVPIMIRNGSLNPGKMFEASKLTWFNDLLQKDNPESRKEWGRLTELGLTHGVTTDELNSMAKQAVQPWQDFLSGKPKIEKVATGYKMVAKAYQSMDVVRKVATFYDLRGGYQKAFPEKSDAELDRYVADIIHDIDPSYDRASKAVKAWSRYVPLGPFVTFNAEMIRTSVNHARITARELVSDNTHLRRLGMRKLLGTGVAAFGPAALAQSLHAMWGVDDEELEDIRKRVAPWSANSDLVVYELDRENQKVGVIDISYTDPFNVFKKPLTALLRGQGDEALSELTDFITGEDILAGGLVSVLRNKDANGRPVYDEGTTADRQNAQIAAYIAKQMEPGTSTSLRRIANSETDKKTAETLAFLTGFRATPFSIKTANFYRNREYASKLQKSNTTILKALKRIPLEELEAVLRDANTQRRSTFDEWHEFSQGTARLGANALKSLLTDLDGARGGSRRLARFVYTGRYQPYRPGEETLNEIRKLPDGIERVRLLNQLNREWSPAVNQ